jgi:two-component system NarL family sensor kinase
MNGRMRSVFGPIENLMETMGAHGSITDDHHLQATVCFTRMYHSSEGALLAVKPQVRDGAAVTMLDAVEGALLANYFRLEKAERRLSDHARSRKRNSGRAAIRQIEMERQRLGRELHTGVGQMLAAIRMQVELIGAQLSGAPRPVEQALERVSSLAGDALEIVRGVSRRIHPPEWQRVTLDAALLQLWENSGIPQKYQASVDLHPLFRDPDPELKALLYRGAQEALSNIIRHSGATAVKMSLEVREEHIYFSISDNGVGFDPVRLASAPPDLAAGLGLRSIQEQAISLRGNLKIDSGTTGTTLTITVPFVRMDTSQG